MAHYNSPKPGMQNTAETKTSAGISSRGETTDKARKGITETFKPGKNYDTEMEAKFGKEPSEREVLAKFAGQEKFKGKNYQEILAQLEQDENKPMADRLRKQVKGQTTSMSSEEEDKALAKAGYGNDEGGIKPLDEKAKKKIEANKSADMSGLNVLVKDALQVGDIIIDQPGVKEGCPVFRWDKAKKNYTGLNYSKFPTEEARMQELKKLFKWHEVTDSDLKGAEKKEEKKPEAPKAETPKSEEKKSELQKVEAIKEDKKADKKSKKGFFTRVAKGTGKVIARPFKKSRQATKRTGKALGKTAKFTFNTSKALVKSTVKTLFVRADLPGYRLEKRSFSKGTKAWTQGYKNHRTFKK